jgi:hypothetical protein
MMLAASGKAAKKCRCNGEFSPNGADCEGLSGSSASICALVSRRTVTAITAGLTFATMSPKTSRLERPLGPQAKRATPDHMKNASWADVCSLLPSRFRLSLTACDYGTGSWHRDT